MGRPSNDPSWHPAPVDVAIAFLTCSRPLDSAGRLVLRRAGVPEIAIEHDPGRDGAPIRAARVVAAGRYFDFAAADDPDARPAFVAVARDWRADSSDLIAFDLGGRVGRWLGREAVLGAHHVLAPRLGEPLRVFPNVVDWLRAGRDGIVALDWRRAVAELQGVSLAVDDIRFGQTARERLTRPAPPIVVRRSAKVAA